jgi:hypothetical protein
MKRYGPVGSHYNSKKYLAMHNRNISEGLKRYHRHKKGIYTEEEIKAELFSVLILLAIFVIIFLIMYIMK